MKKSTAALLLLLGVLIGAPVWVGLSAIATDISTSDWSETDASNNQTAPAGFPEGMAPSGVNNAARAVMGAVKRFWNRANATVTATGSAGVYALSYTVAPSTYVNGETFSFRANHTNPASGASLNVSSLGARTVVKPSTNGLIAVGASDIASGNHVVVQYDSTADQFAVVGGLASSSGGTTYTGGDGISVSGSSISLSVNTLTTLSSPATDDTLPIYDTSASAHRGISLNALLSIVNVLTEETSVQSATDFVPMYDVSAGAIRKVKPENLSALVVSVTSFTASGTWTKNPASVTGSLKYALVIVTGGGGGTSGSGAGANSAGAGGGGAGGTCIRLLAASALGVTESVTIGAGGTGGGGGSSGGNTTFGSLATGNGGSAGGAQTGDTVSGTGGAGGSYTCSSGLGITGGSGAPGAIGISGAIAGSGGVGGASFWGGGGAGSVATASGADGGNGSAYGTGGGGGSAGNTADGAAGVAYVLEFRG